LDQGFFPSRWERASKAEKTFLHHMAVDGDEGSSTSELVQRARKKHSSMTMTGSSLIKKGVIYAPALGRVAVGECTEKESPDGIAGVREAGGSAGNAIGKSQNCILLFHVGKSRDLVDIAPGRPAKLLPPR
jgi:hypothetical protein